MDTAQLFNGKGRQIGEMTVKLNSSTNQTYSLFDFVPKIDPDSIRHLDERLSEPDTDRAIMSWKTVSRCPQSVFSVPS